MVKPCDDDLREVANWLDDISPDAEIYPAAKRVATWIYQSERGDYATAKKLGCTTAYYRKYIKGKCL